MFVFKRRQAHSVESVCYWSSPNKQYLCQTTILLIRIYLLGTSSHLVFTVLELCSSLKLHSTNKTTTLVAAVRLRIVMWPTEGKKNKMAVGGGEDQPLK